MDTIREVCAVRVIHPSSSTINVEGKENSNEVQIGLWWSPV